MRQSQCHCKPDEGERENLKRLVFLPYLGYNVDLRMGVKRRIKKVIKLLMGKAKDSSLFKIVYFTDNRWLSLVTYIVSSKNDK